MAILRVLTVPDPRLKIKAKPVEAVDGAICQLMDDMLETMYAEDGMGLAATQVAIDRRVIVIDLNAGNENPPLIYKMANPELLWTSEEMSSLYESCLSVPQAQGLVERPARIRLRYLDEHNIPCEMEADELLATCIQHEIDHLNGIVYIDHLSRLKRDMILRKLAKARKFNA